MLGGALAVAHALTLFFTLEDIQPPPDPSLEAILSGVVARTRRAIAFGPTVGSAIVYAPSPSSGEGDFSFGLELNTFKVPIVPSVETLKQMIQERFQARVKERLVHLQRPDEHLIRQVYEDVKNEVLGELNVRPHVWEDPQLSLHLEGDYLFRADTWQVRAILGAGVSKITIGPVLTFHAGVAKDLLLGGEVAAHFLPTDGPRSPVIDVFLRLEFPTIETDRNAALLLIGGRLQLDII